MSKYVLTSSQESLYRKQYGFTSEDDPIPKIRFDQKKLPQEYQERSQKLGKINDLQLLLIKNCSFIKKKREHASSLQNKVTSMQIQLKEIPIERKNIEKSFPKGQVKIKKPQIILKASTLLITCIATAVLGIALNSQFIFFISKRLSYNYNILITSAILCFLGIILLGSHIFLDNLSISFINNTIELNKKKKRYQHITQEGFISELQYSIASSKRNVNDLVKEIREKQKESSELQITNNLGIEIEDLEPYLSYEIYSYTD